MTRILILINSNWLILINSKQQTFNEMNANRNTLVCYEDVRDVFVNRKESVFPMQTHLDMGTNYIYNVKTPINNDKGKISLMLIQNYHLLVV